jgi:hypothetical protein
MRSKAPRGEALQDLEVVAFMNVDHGVPCFVVAVGAGARGGFHGHIRVRLRDGGVEQRVRDCELAFGALAHVGQPGPERLRVDAAPGQVVPGARHANVKMIVVGTAVGRLVENPSRTEDKFGVRFVRGRVSKEPRLDSVRAEDPLQVDVRVPEQLADEVPIACVVKEDGAGRLRTCIGVRGFGDVCSGRRAAVNANAETVKGDES